MPKPINTKQKIDRLAEIAINDYEIDPQIIGQLSKRAKSVNARAETAGFENTDVFLGEDGSFSISAYFENKSIGVAILRNGYDYYVESNRKIIDFQANSNERKIFSNLDIWGVIWGRLWHSLESYQSTHMTQIEGGMEGLTPLPFGEIPQTEFQLSRPIALTPKKLIPVPS